MYGTTLKFRLVAGSEAVFRAHLDALQPFPIEGWVSTTYFHSDADPLEIWMSVVYESEESFRASFDSTTQQALMLRFRSVIEAEPEYHDGEVLYHAVPNAG